MSEFRTIEIDFDIHKRIEAARNSFAESPNAVLRRLLNVNGAVAVPSANGTSGRSWSSKGVTLPHGTEVRMEYGGQVHVGAIRQGTWVVEGKEYKSPSAAAGGSARTKEGSSPSLDGWLYWQAKRPGDAA